MATANTKLAATAVAPEETANDNTSAADGKSNIDPWHAKVAGDYIEQMGDLLEEKAALAAKEKALLDKAEKEGYSRKWIKKTANEIANPMSEKDKEDCNRYRKAAGMTGDLFVTATKH